MPPPITLTTPLPAGDLRFDAMSFSAALSALEDMRLSMLAESPDVEAEKLLGQTPLPVGEVALARTINVAANDTVAGFGLNPFDVDDFGRKVLASAHGNPGQILTMCRLAARPEYHDGKHIKFLPLRMDALMGSTS